MHFVRAIKAFLRIHKIIGSQSIFNLILLLVFFVLSATFDAFAAASSFILIASLTGTSIFSSPLIDRIIEAFRLTTSFSVLLFVVVSSIAAILRLAAYILTEKHALYSASRVSFYLNLSSFSYDMATFFSTEVSSRQSFAVNYIDTVSLFIEDFLRLLSQLLAAVFVVITLFTIKPVTLSCIVLILISVYIFNIIVLDPYVARIGSRYAALRSQYLALVSDAYNGFRDIFLHSSQVYYANRLYNADIAIRRSVLYSRILGSLPKYLVELIVYLLFLAFFLYVIYTRGSFALVTTFLFILLLIIQRLLPAIQNIYYSMTSVLTAYPSVQTCLSEIFVSSSEIYPQQLVLPPIRDNKFVIESYEADGLTIYQGGSKLISDISFYLKSGSMLGVYGPSGSGKSTFCDVLMGLSKGFSGRLTVNNQALENIMNNQYTFSLWLDSISHVGQSIFIEQNTLASNIAFGVAPELIDMDCLYYSARIACLEEFVHGLKEGFDTIISSSNYQLSGGQKQRLAIARAVYKNPSILILDEATNALDAYTESQVFQNLRLTSNDRITIVISHNPTVLRLCSSILSLHPHSYGFHEAGFSFLD